MIKTKISKFDNGLSQSKRNPDTSFSSDNGGFDIYSDPYRLSQFIETATEETASGTISDFRITDVDIATFSGTTSLVAIGRESNASEALKFFRKTSSYNIDSTWQPYGVSTHAYIPGTLIIFRGEAYAITTNNSNQYYLEKYNGVSAPTVIGTITPSYLSNNVPRPFVHPLDNILYFGVANQIGSYDPSRATPFVASAITVPVDQETTSITSYGGYLAVATKPQINVGQSFVYLWGRDSTITTFQEKIEFGVQNLMVLENIGGILFGVSIDQNTDYNLSINNTLTIRGYSGGYAQIITEISAPSTRLYNFKRLKENKLYFYVDGSKSLYAFYKNKSGSYCLTKEQFIANGTAPTNLRGFSFIGDYMFVCYDISPNTGYTYRTVKNGVKSTNTAYYITTENAGIDSPDRAKLKTLKSAHIMWTSTANNSAVTLSYSVDGGAFVELINTSGVAGEYTHETVTESNGDPLKTFKTIKFKITGQYGAEIQQIGFSYENNQTIQ